MVVGSFSGSQRCRGWRKWVQMTSAEGNSETATGQPPEHHVLLCEVKCDMRARVNGKESRRVIQAIAQGREAQKVTSEGKQEMSSVPPFGPSLNTDSDESQGMATEDFDRRRQIILS